ncbi:unnamed protein product [Nezara viridula]|uniref:Uncharacterized protein n=1 Tax=Nezara viridula TaxID=85310 RepID=A0A9P0HGJ5_NEZVI|nr:unnamed protein product [Nezara viridula]
MGDCIGHNEAEKKENMDNPVVIYVCKNHDYVVVDVQFQGHETEYEIIQEQFEFELVGSRIHVRPCAPDHPQGAGYSDHPRKRPASPPNDDPCEVFRAVKPKIKQERQTRSAKARSPSPSRRSLVEKQIIRFPLTRRRPQRVNMKSEDSNTRCNSALNDREPRSNMKQYRPSKEKRCSFSDTHIYDEEDEEEDKRKNDENKKSKGTGKNVKKEPSKEPEEVKGSKNKVQNSKKKDKNKQVEKQKSKTGRTSKSPTIKVEKSEDETEDDTKEEALLKDV